MEKLPPFREGKEKKNSLASMALEKISNDHSLFAELAKEIIQKEPYIEKIPLALVQESILLYIGENFVSNEKGQKKELMETFKNIVENFCGENKAEIASLMDVYEKKILPKMKKRESNEDFEPEDESKKPYFDQKMAAAGDDDPNEK